MSKHTDDHLDSLFDLEEQYYQAGYREGRADGIRGGKIDGRSVGLKAGFERFLESGRLAGRAVVWANRQQPPSQRPPAGAGTAVLGLMGAGGDDGIDSSSDGSGSDRVCALPPLPAGNVRLRKNISTLWALVEPETLPMTNTDEAVDDFTDRVRRAAGKAKVIRRIVGEEGDGLDSPGGAVIRET